MRISDCSSDVCSSDLVAAPGQATATMRTDISCTLFLCEPDEYDGGELVIHDTYGEHEVKLPTGDLDIYPSTSLHRVEPVTRVARLAMIGKASWWERVCQYGDISLVARSIKKKK